MPRSYAYDEGLDDGLISSPELTGISNRRIWERREVRPISHQEEGIRIRQSRVDAMRKRVENGLDIWTGQPMTKEESD